MPLFTRIVAAAVLTSTSAFADAPDAWITMKAKMALVDAIGAEALDVDVDTTNGSVTLHGLLDSADEKQAALRAVRGIDGTAHVRDLLAVVDDPEDVELADRLLRSRLERRLDADPRLHPLEVTIDSISNGTVLLRVEGEYYEDVVTLKRVALRVPGVRQIVTEIEYTTDDGEPNFESRRYVNEYGTGEESISLELDDDVQAGLDDVVDRSNQWLTDSWITAEVKLELFGSEAIDGLEVFVDTNDGVVTLFGEVGDDTERREAIALATTVAGVEDVIDSLRIRAHRETPVIADDVIRAELDSLMDEHAPFLPLDDVSWKVEDAVVHVDGAVPTSEDRYQLVALARAVDGVVAVTDDLDVASRGDG